MAKRKPKGARAALRPEEVAQQSATELPDREAMSVVNLGLGDHSNGNFTVPINTAEAANVDSSYSYAIAQADQVVDVDQTVVSGP
jgi:hypothetical protein